MRLLALDPSTDVVGVVLLDGQKLAYWASLTAPRGADLRAAGELDESPSSLQARTLRIWDLRQQLEALLATWPAPDVVAYEFHTGRGGAASEAISEATGAFLSIWPLPQCRQYRILPSTAKAAWGGGKLRRVVAKVAVTKWAKLETGIELDEAQADALAVARAAQGKMRMEALGASQLTMRLK